METTNQYLHEVVMVAIVIKDGKYLITRRLMGKKRSPGKWTIPGGRLETSDYVNSPRDTEKYWYNVLEKTLKREVLEEVSLKVDNLQYITSLATVHDDGAPSIAITCMVNYVSGQASLQEEEADEYAWVTLEEAGGYDLIDGIYDELVMADRKLKGERAEWKRS